MGTHPWRAATVSIAVMFVALAGCRDEPPVVDETGGSSSSGGVDAHEHHDSSGEASSLCEPGETQACYDGPFGTADVGLCRSGLRSCTVDGSQWSACVGEVWPMEDELCQTPEDDDCDGSTACTPRFEWAQSISGFVYEMGVTPEGSVVATGYDGGEFEQANFFVLALDATGELEWFHTVSDGADVQVYDMALDAGNGEATLVGYYLGVPDFGGGGLPPAVGIDAFAVRYATDGTVQWGNTLGPSGYYTVGLGEDGTAYVTGENIAVELDDELVEGSFFVAAIDPSGELEWITVGSGVYFLNPFASLNIVGSDELMMVALLGSSGESELGGVPLNLDSTGPVAIWMGLDGTVREHRYLTEEPPLGAARVWSNARPGGAMTVSDVYLNIDGDFSARVQLAAFDEQRQFLSSAVIGSEVTTSYVDAYPGGATLLGLNFSGSLELGSIGVALPSFQSGHAVAVVDDSGDGQWVEVLSGEFTRIDAVASGPDGAVFVAGDAGAQGTLAGGGLTGRFIAKLRP